MPPCSTWSLPSLVQLPHVTFAFPNSHCWSLQQIDEPHLQIDSQPRDANPQRSKRIEQKSVKDLGIEDSFKLLHDSQRQPKEAGVVCCCLRLNILNIRRSRSCFQVQGEDMRSPLHFLQLASDCSRLQSFIWTTLGGDHPLSHYPPKSFLMAISNSTTNSFTACTILPHPAAGAPSEISRQGHNRIHKFHNAQLSHWSGKE